jgi:mevalonate kinase
MTRNQQLLREMGVSAPVLERLVAAAQEAGALGAKLSGAGRGGNVIALVKPEARRVVEEALFAAGARHVISTTVE